MKPMARGLPFRDDESFFTIPANSEELVRIKADEELIPNSSVSVFSEWRGMIEISSISVMGTDTILVEKEEGTDSEWMGVEKFER